MTENSDGDPNFGEGRSELRNHSPDEAGRPKLAWSKASEIAVGDRVYLARVYMHTVVESGPAERGLWSLTFANPELDVQNVHSSGKLSSRFPKQRHVTVNPNFIYRKIIGVMPG